MVIADNSISVVNANKASLYLVAATSVFNHNDISGNPSEPCKQYLEKIEGKSYKNLIESHIDNYQELFSRVDLDLGAPELAEACKVTLLHRGDGGTGWSRRWEINFWARLLEGDHSFLLLKNWFLSKPRIRIIKIRVVYI